MLERLLLSKGNIYNIHFYNNRYLFDEFKLFQYITIEMKISSKFFQLSDGAIINLRILDTVGQEQFNSLYENYYKQADCCLLVYDITSKESFNILKNYYIDKIKEKCNRDIKVILLGNKTDLEDKREVSQDEGKDLANEKGYIFMESSCKDNYNVSDAFSALVEMTNHEYKKFNRVNSFRLKYKDVIENINKDKKKSKCC